MHIQYQRIGVALNSIQNVTCPTPTEIRPYSRPSGIPNAKSANERRLIFFFLSYLSFSFQMSLKIDNTDTGSPFILAILWKCPVKRQLGLAQIW